MFNWFGEKGSNLQHPGPKPDVLPIELSPKVDVCFLIGSYLVIILMMISNTRSEFRMN